MTWMRLPWLIVTMGCAYVAPAAGDGAAGVKAQCFAKADFVEPTASRDASGCTA